MKISTLTLSTIFLAGSLGVIAHADAAAVLTAKNGMTLYVFDKDVGGTPTCYAACAAKWPPYQAAAGETMGAGWTQISRTDGTEQWAYDGKPVYFYAGDKNKGDKTGDGFGGVWHVIVG